MVQCCIHVDSGGSAELLACSVTSLSGRGLVVIEGSARLRSCQISGCAATGVYVGSSLGLEGASIAVLRSCSVTGNGVGADRRYADPVTGQRVRASHSGVFVQDGTAYVVGCVVSGNTFTGISGSAGTGCRVVCVGSEVKGNGAAAVELPPLGSESEGRCAVLDGAGRDFGGREDWEGFVEEVEEYVEEEKGQ